MAANITLPEAAYLAETLLPCLTVDEQRVGPTLLTAFRRFRHPHTSGGYGEIDWNRVMDEVLRPLVLHAVKQSGGRSGFDPVRIEQTD